MIPDVLRSITVLGMLLLLGCAHSVEHSENLLRNGSFEEGREPWFDLTAPSKPYWSTFSISDEHSSQGRYSARLAIDSQSFRTSVGISGAIQDLTPEHLPRRLSGRIWVEDWKRGTSVQYVQVVVAARKPSNFADFRDIGIQSAVILAGVDQPPFEMSNRRFRIAGPVEPPLQQWIPFEIDLHELFGQLWSGVPEGFERFRLFLEARFDQFDHRNDEQAIAVVYFDDLYLGD
jgi:hypothetical protein